MNKKIISIISIISALVVMTPVVTHAERTQGVGTWNSDGSANIPTATTTPMTLLGGIKFNYGNNNAYSALSSNNNQVVGMSPGVLPEWSFAASSTIWYTPTTTPSTTYFDAQILPNGNLLYVAGRETNGNETGVAEITPLGQTVFTWHDPNWLYHDGPESAWKYPNGNYLISDVDAGAYAGNLSQVYEMRPDNTKVWSWTQTPSSQNINDVLPVTIKGIDSIVLFGMGNPSQTHVSVIRRDNQQTVWDMGGFVDWASNGDFRNINGVNYLLVASWHAANTTNTGHVKLINYDTKTVIATTTIPGVDGTYGPLNAKFIDDNTFVTADGNTKRISVFSINPARLIWQSPVFEGYAMSVSVMNNGRQVMVANWGNGGRVINLGMSTTTQNASFPTLTVGAGQMWPGFSPSYINNYLTVNDTTATSSVPWYIGNANRTMTAPVAGSGYNMILDGLNGAGIYNASAVSSNRLMFNTSGNYFMGISSYNTGTISKISIGRASALSATTLVDPMLTILDSTGVAVGTSTPVANFQATIEASNSTTTIEFGKANQNKGSCIKLYRQDGSAIYASVAAGATTLTLSTTACATITGF